MQAAKASFAAKLFFNKKRTARKNQNSSDNLRRLPFIYVLHPLWRHTTAPLLYPCNEVYLFSRSIIYAWVDANDSRLIRTENAETVKNASLSALERVSLPRVKRTRRVLTCFGWNRSACMKLFNFSGKTLDFTTFRRLKCTRPYLFYVGAYSVV